jgi:LacI family transcriptional regulator, galactose operon repressor
MQPKNNSRSKAPRGPTLRDVAEEAKVSTAAVSKVLHGGGESVRVGPDRAAHIRAVAERLNYRVNALARNLRTSRTRTIGVFFENLKGLNDGPLYTTNLLDGVASVLFTHGYRLTLLAEVDHHDVIGSLGDGQLEGVIWCKLARDEETLSLIRKMPIPIVAFNAAAPEQGTDAVYVNCDNEGGMELAVGHLWVLGHRRIAFLYEGEERDTPDCIARREGYERALRRVGGLPLVTEWTWHLEGLTDHLVASGCTAVLCWTESVAGRLLEKLTEAEIAVPSKMSVIGFDSTQYCETTTPRLTAVRQPIREMAAFAAQTLLDLISGNTSDKFSKVFPCTLDVRGSTATHLKGEEVI